MCMVCSAVTAGSSSCQSPNRQDMPWPWNSSNAVYARKPYMLVKLCVPAACCNSTSASQATNETDLNESAITEDMKQATDYAQVLVSRSKCDTTCMHGWRGSVQGKDQQQTLKPQMKLRGSIGNARKICEDVGKLGLPQATDKTERLCGAALLLCDNAF